MASHPPGYMEGRIPPRTDEELRALEIHLQSDLMGSSSPLTNISLTTQKSLALEF
jgi:hypothetical protein